MVTLPMPSHCCDGLRPVTNTQLVHDICHVVLDGLLAELKLDRNLAVGQAPVSYTHLTLPTNREV